jgi:hypothetical protein
MRYRLRTLMILMAILPPLIAWWGWPTMQRILWPPKPEFQFHFNFSGNGFSGRGITFDFAFPVQPGPPPTAAVRADGDPPAVQASTDNRP